MILDGRTQLACLLFSITAYFSGLAALHYFELLPDSLAEEFPESAWEHVPENFVDGMISFKPAAHRGSTGIRVITAQGRIEGFVCYPVDRRAFPDAIPCSEAEFSGLNHKSARLWYIKSRNYSEEEGKWENHRRIAAQLLIYPDRLYSLASQKNALRAFWARPLPLSYFLLLVVAHGAGILLVTLLSFAATSSFLESRAKRKPNQKHPAL